VSVSISIIIMQRYSVAKLNMLHRMLILYGKEQMYIKNRKINYEIQILICQM